MTAVSTDPTVARPLQRTVAKTPPKRQGRRARRWIKRSALIAAGLGVLGILGYAWMPKPVPVDIATVRRAPLEVSVTDDGRTRVRNRFVVSAPIAGNLVRIELEPGATVEAGAVIARIAPPDPAVLDEHTRAVTEARLSAALARKHQTDAAIARARVTHASAVREARRVVALTTAGAVTGTERERAELAADLAANDLAQAEMNRSAASAEVAAARAALGLGVHGGSATLAIAAPVRGTVLRVVRDDAGPVAAGTPLIELGDLRVIEAVIDVLSSDAARLVVGAPASIAAWGGERALAGRVRTIEPSAFTRLSALGIEEQRVNVIVAIDAPPPVLGDGFRVEVRLAIWRGDDVLQIPASAMFRDRDRWAVYVVRDGRAQLQHIEIGHRGSSDVEVVAGIADGTTVVAYPGDRIAQGVRVAPR